MVHFIPNGFSVEYNTFDKYVSDNLTFHRMCVPMDKSLMDQWTDDGLDFICRSCAFTDSSHSAYDFAAALRRLASFSAPTAEHLLLKTYDIQLPQPQSTSLPGAIDQVSCQILQKLQPIILKSYKPLSIRSDGNCFYRAVSRSLFGTEDHHLHVRLLAALEMLFQREYYDLSNSPYLGPTGSVTHLFDVYNNEIKAVCTPGRWAGMIHFYAVSAALQVALRSYCPPIMNEHFLTTPLSCKVCGRGLSDSAVPSAIIMWTSCGVPDTESEFKPDHFVILQKLTPPKEQLINLISPSNSPLNTSIDVPAHSPVQQMEEANHDVKESLSEGTVYFTDENSENSENSYSQDHHASETSSVDTSADGGQDLPNKKFLPVSEMITYLTTYDSTPSPFIPDGLKEYKFFIVDNTRNVERRAANMKSQFVDDCGAWKASPSPVARFIKASCGEWISVVLRGETYCSEKQGDGKRKYTPIKPQIDEEDVLKIHRNYNILKSNANYKRRVTWLEPSDRNLACVEYVGKYTGPELHGNAKYSKNPYTRTAPSIFDAIAKESQTSTNRALECSRERDRPKNLKQVQNMAFNERKKDKSKSNSGGNNLADNIIYLHSTMHKHPFIRHIHHDQHHVPCIILYTDDQIRDVRRFCCSSPIGDGTVLGIDKTFNLGQLYVTATVFKHLALKRMATDTHPLFFGPILLHGNSTWETYGTFFNILSMKLIGTTSKPVIGSDDETAIRKAAKFVFPSSNLIACERHLKNNVIAYLRDKVGASTKTRGIFVQAIF